MLLSVSVQVLVQDSVKDFLTELSMFNCGFPLVLLAWSYAVSLWLLLVRNSVKSFLTELCVAYL
jgi:hypothetical protein